MIGQFSRGCAPPLWIGDAIMPYERKLLLLDERAGNTIRVHLKNREQSGFPVKRQRLLHFPIAVALLDPSSMFCREPGGNSVEPLVEGSTVPSCGENHFIA